MVVVVTKVAALISVAGDGGGGTGPARGPRSYNVNDRRVLGRGLSRGPVPQLDSRSGAAGFSDDGAYRETQRRCRMGVTG